MMTSIPESELRDTEPAREWHHHYTEAKLHLKGISVLAISTAIKLKSRHLGASSFQNWSGISSVPVSYSMGGETS